MVDRAWNPKIEFHSTPRSRRSSATPGEGVRVRDTRTGERARVPIEGLFIAIGHAPNTDVFADWLDPDEKGYLVAHEAATGSRACSSRATSTTTSTARP